MFRMILAFFLLICFTQASALTLKIATISPDGTSWMKALRQGAAEIKARTAGRVKIRFYPGGVMGSDRNVLRKIRFGQLQGGALTGGGLQQIYFDSQIYSLPFAFRSLQEVDYVRAQMDPLIEKGLYQRGFISFGLAEGGFAYLMSNRPIRANKDLKGHKVWVPEGDTMSQMAFKSAHISPVPLPLPDVLTGLQTGLIDTIGASTVGAIALQWHTRVKYVTDTPLLYLYGILIVKRQAFEKLAVPDQTVVREIMSAVFRQLNRLNRDENAQARQALMDEGIRFVRPTPAAQQNWEQLVAQLISDVEKHGGRFLSSDMLHTLITHLNAFRARQL